MPWWLLDYRVWLVAALAASSIYAAVQRLGKEHVQAEFAQFRADVEAEAAKAKVRNAQIALGQAQHAEEVVSDLQTRLDRANARYASLRTSSGSGSGTVPALSTAAPSLEACPGEPSQSDAVARRMDQIEATINRVLEGGDKEIAKLVELYKLQEKNASSPSL